MRGNWIVKYKLYHIPFWISYHYLWWTITIANPIKAANAMFYSPYTVKFLFYFVFQALAVYFNLYFLMPRYLRRQRYVPYVVYLSLTVLATSLIVVGGYYVGAIVAGKSMQELYGVTGNCFYSFFGNAFPSTVAVMTLGMSIKLTKTWMQTERKQRQLEMEKIDTELKFLKYQINPHFLFNSINSIFFLIHKNPDKASDSLAKFSELLRYQLYECNDTRIGLSREVEYLENFIELEKLRLNKNVEIDLDLEKQHPGSHRLSGMQEEKPAAEDCQIAPFILMTFVENAFKHVSKYTERPNWISIRLRVEGNELEFAVTNSKSDLATREVVSYGGIGLKNVQRRLDLLYPGQHVLEIDDDESSFSVRLRLRMSGLVINQPILEKETI